MLINELLVVGGMTYTVTNKKLQYAVNTQFNYFKFPPRIKDITINDAISLDDVLGELDTVSGRYTVSETVGMPPEDGSDKLVYRAGSYDESNSSKYYAAPDLNPVGYKLYKGSLDKQDHGGWVLPTILDMGLPLDGDSFIKPNTFIVTPELIEAGENIYFKIQVAIRISLAEAWMDFQRSADPTSETADLNQWLNAEKDSSTIMYTPGYSNIQPPIPSAQAYAMGTAKSSAAWGTPSAYFQKIAANFAKQSSYQNAVYIQAGFDPDTGLPIAGGAGPAVPLESSIKIQNSVLIELNMRRIDDLPDIKNEDEGALAGTFITKAKTNPGFLPGPTAITYVGNDDSLLLKKLLVDIDAGETLYRSKLNLYNNLVSQTGDRSTNSQLAELASAKFEVDFALADLKILTTNFDMVQTRLKADRLNYLRTNNNPEIPPLVKSSVTATTGTYRYDVQKMTPVKSNVSDMLYNIYYMVDISTAKPYDEYFITTAAGSPYNLIYKRNTVWDIALQSKLKTLL